MLRYKTETRPGLVALYDIRSGKGAGQFLQPRRPHGAGHFRDESFQSITCTGTDNLTRTTKRQKTQITQYNTMQNGTLVNSTTDTLKNIG